MHKYPIYQDSIAAAEQLRQGALPLYLIWNTLHEPSPLHHHDYSELSFIIEGSGTEMINGRIHPLNPGTVSFLLPHHIHSLESNPGSTISLICCMFDMNLIFGTNYENKLASLLLQTGEQLPSFYNLDEAETARIRAILEEMKQELDGNAYGKDLLVRTKLIEVLTRLVRSHKQTDDPGEEAGPASIGSSEWNLIRYVHMHFHEAISLKSLSNLTGWSPSHISRLFKQQTGQNFLDHLHSLRVGRASSLLLTTDMSISEIALEVGYDNFRRFSRVFKQFKGVTPTEYRSRSKPQ